MLEQKDVIEQDILDQVAMVLNVPADAIKNFDEEKAIVNIQNNFEGSHNQGANLNYQCTINPFDKWVEALEENKKLYERLLQAEKEKNELLERILNKK